MTEVSETTATSGKLDYPALFEMAHRYLQEEQKKETPKEPLNFEALFGMAHRYLAAEKLAEYVPTDELIKSFKEVAFNSRAHDLWSQIVKSVPRGTTDPIRELISARVQESKVSLSVEEVALLASRYNILLQKAELKLSDKDLNHWALVNFFLGREGVIVRKPAQILSWRKRNARRLAAAAMATLAIGGVGKEVLPRVAAGLLAPPVLSAQTILRPASAEELQSESERTAFFKELEGFNQYVKIRNNISEDKQVSTQTTTSATLIAEKPTFFIPGTDTETKVDITNNNVRVLRPAGDGRFLVETDSGVFEIPFGDIQLKEILWNRGREPLPWLGFDSEYPQVIEKIPQIGAGIVRLSLDQADEKVFKQKSEALKTIEKAKELNLKIIIAYNPTRLLPDEEATKRLDRILSLMGNYKNFALELGNEPDLIQYWDEEVRKTQDKNDWNLESFAKFISQTSNILNRKGARINLIIGSLTDHWDEAYVNWWTSELAQQLRNQHVDLSQFVFSFHVFHDPSRIKMQVETLKREFGDNVSVIVTEGGSTDLKEKGERTVQIIKEARKYGAQEVIVHQLRNKKFELKYDENDPDRWGYIDLDEKTGRVSWLTTQIGPILEYVWQEGQPVAVESKESLIPFENRVGWAYSAVAGASKEEIVKDMRRMKNLGANIIYIGHNNPGNTDPNGSEPGLAPSVWFALRENTPSKENAEKIHQAIVNALDASAEVGLDVVLPIGYQIQMGQEWNEKHRGELRTDSNGTLMSHWSSGETASPYSPEYKKDISKYYSWVNETIIKKYPRIIAVNLADEPMGSDFSPHAMAAFEQRYGVKFTQASPYQRGKFLSGVIADYAAWSANLWKELNPRLRTMMTFHIERNAPFFPDVERIFSQTPDTFIFSADTHLHDFPPDWPLTQQDTNLLAGMVRTLGWLSKTYAKPLMLWTSANSWGLAGQSKNRGGVEEALQNINIVHDLAKQNGGKIGMIMAWGWNIKGQGVYRDGGNFAYVDKDAMIDQVSGSLLSIRDDLSKQTEGNPDRVLYLPSTILYAEIAKNNTSHLAYGITKLDKIDFIDQDIIYLTDGKALEEAKKQGVKIVLLAP